MRAATEFESPRCRFPLNDTLLRTLLVAGTVSLAAAIGCDNRAAGVSGPEPAVAEQDAGAEQDAEKQAVDVAIEPWKQIIKAATDGGRPAVIDVWSLSCEPCLKSFPELVRLHEEFGDQVKCVSANVDFDGRRTRPPESYQTRVEDFLRLNKSTLANYISATPSDEVYAELDIPSIPAVLIFDADGKEVARFVDAGETIGFTYRDDVIPFVQKMIAGESAPFPADGTAGDD